MDMEMSLVTPPADLSWLTDCDGDRTVMVLVHGRVSSVPLAQMMAPPWIDSEVRMEWMHTPATASHVAVLGHVAVVLDRMLPGMPCYVVPGLRRRAGGVMYGAQLPQGAMMLACNGDDTLWGMAFTVLHEAWHAAELRLSAPDFRLVRQAVSSGIWLPDDGYSNTGAERAADCFAAWACARLSVSACPAAPAWSAERGMDQVFGEVLSGVYGRQAAVKPSLARLLCGDCWWLASAAWKLVAPSKEKRHA